MPIAIMPQHPGLGLVSGRPADLFGCAVALCSLVPLYREHEVIGGELIPEFPPFTKDAKLAYNSTGT